MKKITIENIEGILVQQIPYYESDDKDDFLYIAKGSDIKKVASALYHFFKDSTGKPDDQPSWQCSACGKRHLYDKWEHCPYCGEVHRKELICHSLN